MSDVGTRRPSLVYFANSLRGIEPRRLIPFGGALDNLGTGSNIIDMLNGRSCACCVGISSRTRVHEVRRGMRRARQRVK